MEIMKIKVIFCPDTTVDPSRLFLSSGSTLKNRKSCMHVGSGFPGSIVGPVETSITNTREPRSSMFSGFRCSGHWGLVAEAGMVWVRNPPPTKTIIDFSVWEREAASSSHVLNTSCGFLLFPLSLLSPAAAGSMFQACSFSTCCLRTDRSRSASLRSDLAVGNSLLGCIWKCSGHSFICKVLFK